MQEQPLIIRIRRPMRIAGTIALFLATATLLAGCGGKKSAAPAQTTQTTSDAIKTAVFERSYSECSTASLADLAGKYHARADWDSVTEAVARDWTTRLHGGPDAVPSGRDGCRQAFRSKP